MYLGPRLLTILNKYYKLITLQNMANLSSDLHL